MNTIIHYSPRTTRGILKVRFYLFSLPKYQEEKLNKKTETEMCGNNKNFSVTSFGKTNQSERISH